MYRVRIKTFIKAGAIIVFLIILAVYSYTKSRNLINGPEIIVTSPNNGYTSTTSPVEIVGTAKNVNAMTLNDRTIFTDEMGNFKETVLLSPGYNVIYFTAKDKFGRSTSHTMEFVFDAGILSTLSTTSPENTGSNTASSSSQKF
jgi:hypothetical protein